MAKERKRSARKGEQGQTERPGTPPEGMPAHAVWGVVSAVILALLALVLAVVALFFHFTEEDGEGGTSAVTQPTPTAQPTPTPSAGVSADDDPFIGPKDALVTIIEFNDFQCPFCKRFRDETLDQILGTYEGKVKYVLRDFPLSFHQHAQKAAEASECADDQGKFWDYHDLLFANQNALDVASLKGYAAQLGVDTATFNDCLDTGKHASEVQKDHQDGLAAGVTGTPGFFINDVPVKGAKPFSTFQQVIDAALAGEGEAEQTPTPQAEGGPPSVAGEPTVTSSGLQYIDIEVGSGESPQAGQTLVVHYTGWLADGTKFDSSVDRGQPFSFTLGAGRVIKGWDEGVATMKVGGKRRLIIPPELGYGESGSPPSIPPNAELTFDVELIEIQ